MKKHPNGDGTLLPSTQQVKTEKAGQSPQSKKQPFVPDPAKVAAIGQAYAEFKACDGKQTTPRLPRPNTRPKLPPPAKVTLRFVNEDGSLWREVQLDRSLVESAKPFAAKARRTVEEFILDCLEMAANDAPMNAAAATLGVPIMEGLTATLASPEPTNPARERLNVTLDEEASRLVRWVHAGDPTYTLADVVNGSVRFDYGEEGKEAVLSNETLEAARAARLASERKEGAK